MLNSYFSLPTLKFWPGFIIPKFISKTFSSALFSKPFMKQNKNFSKVFTFPSSWTLGGVKRRMKCLKEENATLKKNTGTIHYFLIKNLKLSATKLDASRNKFNYEPSVLLMPQIPHKGIPTRVSWGKCREDTRLRVPPPTGPTSCRSHLAGSRVHVLQVWDTGKGSG